MQSTPDPYDPAAIERSTREFWKSRGLPPADGSVGPATGARIHQIIGTLASDENPVALTQAGVRADVDARFFALTGRRTVGRLLIRPARGDGPDPAVPELLEAAGAWAGGTGGVRRDPAHDAGRVQHMVERLAASGILTRRESPLRSCPRCRVPRTLAGILYHEEEGPAYLVRFPLTGASPPVSLLVWTDAAWKLLGAPAVLAQADLPYVVARYRRRGSEERVLVAKSSLPRLEAWLPGGEWEVVEEVAGPSLDGRAYDHPLGTESPMLSRSPAPSGQVHLSSEVTDSGTGFVALVPAHGAADAAASRALDLPGWPVLDHDLALTSSFRHKYQGLPVEAGEAFVLRDLREGGYLFAELTVRRGVPRCAVCRTALVWETGSAWCLVPAALSASRLDDFARLNPGERAPPSTEVVPWPVSGRELVDDPLSPELRECPGCHRLSAPDGAVACACGATTAPHRRRLLPVFREALLAWADESPFPSGEAARLYLPARRRVPTLIHHLVAMEATDAHPGDLRVESLATLPHQEALEGWLGSSPRDAARAALVSLDSTPRGGSAALVERRAQHALRLRRYWTLAQSVAAAARADRSLGGMPPIASRLAELLEEDRALLSGFERTRREVVAAYDAGHAALALRLLEQFFDGPLRTLYLPAAGRRLSGPPGDRAPVLALLAHILVTWSELYSPIAPFTSEAVSRWFVADGRSVFERAITPILQSALDPALEERSKSWWAIVEATRRARRHLGIAESVVLPQVVLSARDEARATEIRGASAVIGRLINAGRVEVASPQLPWSARQLQVTPVLPALQKVFGSGAPRVARILQGLPPQRVRDGIRSKTLEIAVEGRPLPIGPAMVEIVDRVPDGFVTFPWTGGELIVEAPPLPHASRIDRSGILSTEAYRVVRRVRQRIRWSARPEGVRLVVVCASGTLSDELVRLAPSLATSLGVPLFRVVGSTDGFPLSETTTGRTGRGVPWAIWVPGSRRPDHRTKQRAARARQERIRRAIRRDPAPEAAAEIQAEPSIRRDGEIDRWVVRLDELVGRPLIGPAKLRAAWDAGLQQYDDLIHAPYERLVAIPGFGPVVAAELIRRAGGSVPTPSRSVVRPTPSAVVVRSAEPPNLMQVLQRADDRSRSPPPSTGARASAPDVAAVPDTGSKPADESRSVATPGDTGVTLPLPPEPEGTPAAPFAREEAPIILEPAPGAPPTPPDPVPSGIAPDEEVGRSAPAADAVAPLPVSDPAQPSSATTDESSLSGTSRVSDPIDAGAITVGMGQSEPTPDRPGGTPSLQERTDRPVSAAEPVAEPSPLVPSDGSPSTDGGPPPPPREGSAEDAPVPIPGPADTPATGDGAGAEVGPSAGLAVDPAAMEPAAEPLGTTPSSDARPREESAGSDAASPSSTVTVEPERVSGVPPIAPPPLEAPAVVLAPEASVHPTSERVEPVPPPAPLREVDMPELPAEEPLVPPIASGSAPAAEVVVPPLGEATIPTQVAATGMTGSAPEAPPDAIDAPPAELDEIGPAEPSAAAPIDLPESPSEEPAPTPVGEAPSPSPPVVEPPATEPLEGPSPSVEPPETSPPATLAPELEVPGSSAAELMASGPPAGVPAAPEPASPEPPTDSEHVADPQDSEAPSPVLPGPDGIALAPDRTEPPLSEPPEAESGGTEVVPPEPLAPEPTPLDVLAPVPLAPGPELVAPEAQGPETLALESSTTEPPAPIAESPPSPPPPAAGLAVSSAALANDAWPLFLDATGAGHRGLCVSREFPDRMRALLGPRDVTIVWLSNSLRPGSVRPTDLEGLAQAVEKAVATEHVRAVYIDHVEYLARVNSPAAVRSLLDRVDAAARAHEARAWVALNPSLLSVEAAEALAHGFPTAH